MRCQMYGLNDAITKALTDTLEDLGCSQEDFWGRNAKVVCALLDRSGTGGSEGSAEELDMCSLMAGNLGESLSDP